MEKCSNCGAAVRPGAKFCTSCGTRLNDSQSSTSTSESQTSPVEETLTATPAAEPESSLDTNENDDRYAAWGQSNSGWNTGETSPPAESFESALDQAPAEESTTQYRAQSTSQESQESSDEDRFASWASAYSAYQEPSAPVTDAAAGQAQAPAGDEEISATTDHEAPASASMSQPDVAPEAPANDSEARQRAATLVDELRNLIWQIGVTDKTDGDDNMAKIVLAGARGRTGEFSDIRRTIEDLKKDPRDIDALRSLGAKSDRIEELLASHSRLIAAIDEAIDELR